jgi:WD40 repeat protein
LSLARERESILAWDGQDNLFVFNHSGAIQAQRPSPMPLIAISSAEDGSGYVLGGSQEPILCRLAPDLAPQWRRSLRERITALALEPLGRQIAVADASGTLRLLDQRGRSQWQATTPRPLHHLVFVPEKPLLVGAADFGLVVCFGTSGECLWRDGLVAHIGSLAVNGDGMSILLACFSDGLYRYSAAGSGQERILLDGACHLAALSYAGDSLLTADRSNRFSLRDSKGTIGQQISLESPIVALALGAMGDYAVVGLADGTIQCFTLDRQS